MSQADDTIARQMTASNKISHAPEVTIVRLDFAVVEQYPKKVAKRMQCPFAMIDTHVNGSIQLTKALSTDFHAFKEELL